MLLLQGLLGEEIGEFLLSYCLRLPMEKSVRGFINLFGEEINEKEML